MTDGTALLNSRSTALSTMALSCQQIAKVIPRAMEIPRYDVDSVHAEMRILGGHGLDLRIECHAIR